MRHRRPLQMSTIRRAWTWLLIFVLQAPPFCLAAPVDGDDTPGLDLAAADWKGLRETVRVGNTIAGVRACTLKVAGAEE